MEELLIEEKAKRYDKAIERAKDYYHLGDDKHKMAIDAKAVMEYIFPELKESEDERIRGAIIDHLKDNNLTEWAAWLEAQGKHANFLDKIQVGDKVTRNEDGVLVNLSQLKRVAKRDEKQGEQKPADETPYPKTLEKAIDLYYYSYGNCEGGFEHLSLEKFRDIVHTFVSDYGQKPAWSEEDEYCRHQLIVFCENCMVKDEGAKRCAHWLKSLKERCNWKPSDEQMDALETAVSSLQSTALESLYNKLKKL